LVSARPRPPRRASPAAAPRPVTSWRRRCRRRACLITASGMVAAGCGLVSTSWRMSPPLRHLLDDLGQLLRLIAVTSRQHYQLARLGHDRAALRPDAGDRDATAAAELHQPFIAQRPQRPQHRVGVDPEHRGKITGRREPLPRPGLALRDRPAERRRSLLVQRNWAQRVDLHDNSNVTHISIIPPPGCWPLPARNMAPQARADAWRRSA